MNEGTYFVHSAFITTDSFITSKGEDKVFEVLEVRVFKEDNSVSRAVLRLNGCWNERKGSDGQPYKASGNFYEFLFAQCTNNNFAEARDFINGGGVSINGTQVKDMNFVITDECTIGEEYTIIRRGKKNYYVIKHVK